MTMYQKWQRSQAETSGQDGLLLEQKYHGLAVMKFEPHENHRKIKIQRKTHKKMVV